MLTHKGTQTIQTDRLILRRAVLEDAEPMFRNWATDPEVTKYLTWPPHESVDVTRSLLERWTAEYENDDYYHWMIVLKEIGQPLSAGNHRRTGSVCPHRLLHRTKLVAQRHYDRGRAGSYPVSV